MLPKCLLSREELYSISVSMANVVDDELVLYDYKVYGTSSRFELGIEEDVSEVFAKFKEHDEALAVRIHGDNKNVEYNGLYWIITDPETIELNIEYYIIPNLKFGNNILPIRTIVGAGTNIMNKINTVYLCLIISIYAISIVPPSIGVIKRIVYLTSKNNNNEGPNKNNT